MSKSRSPSAKVMTHTTHKKLMPLTTALTVGGRNAPVMKGTIAFF